jgi:hypothetical protein
MLELAAERVRELREEFPKMKIEDAAAKVSEGFYSVDPDTLEAYCQGKHASARRMKKRRPKT